MTCGKNNNNNNNNNKTLGIYGFQEKRLNATLNFEKFILLKAGLSSQLPQEDVSFCGIHIGHDMTNVHL